MHVIHRLIDAKGQVTAEWVFSPVSVIATVQFIKAVIANRGNKDVRYVIEITLPRKESK